MSADNIIVAIKVRPLIKKEKTVNLPVLWSVQDKAVIPLDLNGQPYGEPYCFDHVFDENCKTDDIYGEVVKNYIKSAMDGFNLTIFAYGQTSSGKTYTMMGNDHTSGIIQHTINDIFQYIQENTEKKFLISCSYFEIYNEQIYDLLATEQKSLKVREDSNGNISIQTIETITSSSEDVLKVMKSGNKSRKVGSTKMNERSSRSHTIFKITITSSEEKHNVKCSHLYLVDLAGSERIAKTMAEGKTLKEGVNINKSLSVLGNVIRQLTEHDSHISYRDSKLTRILQPALGGNSKSLLITTITLAGGEETKSSLEFSQRAKVVKNKPVINQVRSTDDSRIKEVCHQYQQRVLTLKQKAKLLEFERDKALSELHFLKEGLNQVIKFEEIVNKTETVESKYRRHTLGSYDPTRESVSFTPKPTNRRVFSEDSSSSRTQDVITESPLEDVKEEDEEVVISSPVQETTVRKLSPVIEETTSEVNMSPHSSRSYILDSDSPLELIPSEAGTPSAVSKAQYKSLEESFETLREFTSLEKEFASEEGGFIQRILLEKEKLYDDLLTTRALLINERKKHHDEYKEQQVALNTLNENYDRLKQEMQEMELSKETIEYKYDEQIKDMKNILEESKKQFENKLCYYRDRVIEYRQQNEILAKELEESRQHFSQIDTVQKTDTEILSVMTQTEELETMKLQEKIDLQLKEKTREIQVLNENIIKISSDKKDLTTVIDKLQKETKDLHSQNKALSTELEKAEQEKLKYSCEIEQLKVTEKQLLREMSTGSKFKFQYKSLLQTVSELNQEIQRKMKEIHILKKKENSQDALIVRLEEISSIKSDELKMKREEIETLKQEIREKNEKITKSEYELTNKSKGNEITDRREELSQTNMEKIKQIKKFENELKETKEQMKQLEEQLNERNGKIKNLQFENGQQFEQIKKLKDGIKEQNKPIKIFGTKEVEASPEIQKRSERELERKKKLYTLCDSRRSLSSSDEIDDMEILKLDFEKLQEEDHEKKQIIKQIKIELERIRQINDRLKSDKETLQNKYDQCESDHRAQRRQGLTTESESAENELKENKKTIANLEKIIINNYSKNVNLETNINDMRNKRKAEIATYENKVLLLQNELSELKTKKTGQDISIQTDLTIIDLRKKEEKYEMTKIVANMRREESLKLRKRLGLPPDTEIN